MQEPICGCLPSPIVSGLGSTRWKLSLAICPFSPFLSRAARSLWGKMTYKKKYIQEMTSFLEHRIDTRATNMMTLRVAIKHCDSSMCEEPLMFRYKQRKNLIRSKKS
jgi:hypothetical protein